MSQFVGKISVASCLSQILYLKHYVSSHVVFPDSPSQVKIEEFHMTVESHHDEFKLR
jgi:hypothetical protein